MGEQLTIIYHWLAIVTPICGSIFAAARWMLGKLSHIEKIPALIEAFNEFKKESTTDFTNLSIRVGQVEKDLKDALDVRKEVAELRAEIVLLQKAAK